MKLTLNFAGYLAMTLTGVASLKQAALLYRAHVEALGIGRKERLGECGYVWRGSEIVGKIGHDGTVFAYLKKDDLFVMLDGAGYPVHYTPKESV